MKGQKFNFTPEAKEILRVISIEKYFKISEHLNKQCYFCGYDLIVDLHHIISRKKGGTDDIWNLLPLCPNCHTLINRNKYKLIYKGCYYILQEIKNKEHIVPPTEQQLLNTIRIHPYLEEAI